MRIQTLDIGGANTKKLLYEGGRTRSASYYFPLWKKKEEFPRFLRDISEEAYRTAVTMTAELCDVFPSKKSGVEFIVSVCEEVLDAPLYLTTDQRLLEKDEISDPSELAAANWQASRYLLEKRFGEGILVDVGSTTTDILPFGEGTHCYRSDFERLKNHQLLYTGLLRTPVNTIVSEVPVHGQMVPVSSEYFAITADVYNILWGVDYSCETPDGRGKTREESLNRIARLLCADKEEIEEELPGICAHVHRMQVEGIAEAVKRAAISSKRKTLYVGGIGRRLGIEAAQSLDLPYVDLGAELKDAWNLPCLGLAEMTLELDGGESHGL
ncbi:MAG: hypothetical protein D6733_00280 [Methanobacteriota archaeon]|nr:MAG: hypothetical protein D6733_00280 [Euryarchaeota archaeon]